MAKLKVTENELKKIIRESVETVLNEDGYQGFTGNFRQGFTPEQPAAPAVNGPAATAGQVSDRNTANSNALTAWKKLGTVGQVKLIQKLAGIPEAQCDGKIGPQTLAKVYIALAKGRTGASVDADALNQSSFRPGRVGTYTPIK